MSRRTNEPMSTADTEHHIHLIGNAHLDPAWMWQMEEGLEAFAATCRSALDRIQEFPGFIFTCSSAAQYAYVEETHPELFERIRSAVAEERWAIVGGWWVEPDCNLPSGESLIRQALLGQRYFESRFGKIATVGYNIDSFGHNANLPQLLKKAGIEAYVFMRPGQKEKNLASPLVLWEAPSDDQVPAYRLPLHYSNHEWSTTQKVALLEEQSFYRRDWPWMIFFGVGNHGGGPTVAELKDISQLLNARSGVGFSDPERFFDSIKKEELPIVRGEMQPHAIGCYSAYSEMKQLHRRTERSLQIAERAEVLASLWNPTHAAHIPSSALAQGWKNLCFNEFHDLLGGVAIREACDDAISMYREAISIAERTARMEFARIAARVDTSHYIQNIIVFNMAAHEREELIEFELWQPEEYREPKPPAGVLLRDEKGSAIPTQRIESSGKIGDDRARFLAKVNVPSLGWQTFGIERVPNETPATGTVTLQQLPFPYTPAIIVRDDSDTWGHGVHSFMDFEDAFTVNSVEPMERGPIRRAMRVKSSGSASRLEEEILVEEGSKAIEIRYFLNWHEQHRILKLRFRHGCTDPVATYEIPYAWIRRPIGPNEYPGQSWVNVSERDGSGGFAIITDSKYSYSVDKEYIYVIAARSPLFAHHIPPHEFYALERERYQDQGEQEFRIRVIPHEGNWSGREIARYQSPLVVHPESWHVGTLPKGFGGFERKGRAVHIGAIKMAEDGPGILVRAVEQAGDHSEAEFRLPSLGMRWQATFSPFEIKSFLVQDNAVTEVDFLERPL